MKKKYFLYIFYQLTNISTIQSWARLVRVSSASIAGREHSGQVGAMDALAGAATARRPSLLDL